MTKILVTNSGNNYSIPSSEWHSEKIEDERDQMIQFAHEHRNQLCNLLAGYRKTYYFNCTAEHVAQIKRVLRDQYTAVLLTEEFDKSLILMVKYIMGFELKDVTDIVYAKHKVMNGRPKLKDLPSDVIQVFQEQTAFDREIYEYGAMLFYKKISNLGSEFAQDVERFSVAQEKHKHKCEADTIMGRLNACITY